MATHNVDDGSGGLDASLRFELGRPEVLTLDSDDTQQALIFPLLYIRT